MAVLGTGIVMTLTACSSDDGGTSSAGGVPPVAVVPSMTTMAGRTLPLEAYLLQPDVLAKVMGAREEMVLACMRRSGFDITLGNGGSSGGTELRTQSEQRYVISAEQAAMYGYHRPPDGSEEGDGPPLGEAEITALMGTMNEGGCYREVDAQLAQRGVVLQDDELVSSINREAMQRSMEDPRLTEAFASWSACMGAKGYRYATPMDASGDARWSGATTSPEEIDAAVTDLACMGEHNVVGLWFAVESAYQKELIEKNFEKLEEVRRAAADSVRVVDQLAAAGPQS